jgi:DNA-binding NarL/FixJ family response regulator
MRDGLRSLIEKQNGMAVVGEAENGRIALRLTRTLQPDVIVMDINMPDLNGIDATRQILAELPSVKIVAFSMHSDRQFVAEMFKAGVSGYLLKDAAFDELAKAIRTVADNQTYLCPKVADTVIKDYREQLHAFDPSDSAVPTDREREIIQLLAEGNTTKQIAHRLNLSIKTIESHRRNIMEKLKIHSIAELTKFAIREGLTTLDT